MKEPYIEGMATRDDPESCAGTREGGGEALTGARMGRVLSPVSFGNRSADAVQVCGRPHGPRRIRLPGSGSSGSETVCTCGNSRRENREIHVPPLEWREEPRWERQGGNPPMHGTGKSDRPVVLTKRWNKVARAAADGVEGRGLVGGNTTTRNTHRTQSRRER